MKNVGATIGRPSKIGTVFDLSGGQQICSPYGERILPKQNPGRSMIAPTRKM